MQYLDYVSLSNFSLTMPKFLNYLDKDARDFIKLCKENNINVFMQGTGINHVLVHKKGRPYDWDFFVIANPKKMEYIIKRKFKVKPIQYKFLGKASNVYLVRTKSGIRIDYKVVENDKKNFSESILLQVLYSRGLIPLASLLVDFRKNRVLSFYNGISDFKKGIIRSIRLKGESQTEWETAHHMDVTYFLFYPKLLCNWNHTKLSKAELSNVVNFFKKHNKPIGRFKDKPSELLWALLRIINEDDFSRGFTYWFNSGAINWLFSYREQKELINVYGSDFKSFDKLSPTDRIRNITNLLGDGFIRKLKGWISSDISDRRKTSSEEVVALFDYTVNLVNNRGAKH